jgi:phosphomannomutase
MAATPTVEFAVKKEKADGGIIISASHNPQEWNAIKLLNKKGEFLSSKEGKRVLDISGKKEFPFTFFKGLGTLREDFSYTNKHIKEILKLKLVDKKAISKKNFKVVVDGINSVGSFAVYELLLSLGLKKNNIIVINKEIAGVFNHNPEPIDKNLKDLCRTVKNHKADLGIAVDPDVDRLAVIDEKGNPIGEEYTLVFVADYIFKNYHLFKGKYKKTSVSNLSSSMALKDLSSKYGARHLSSLVGEVNVVDKMKKNKAVIGGEGNGGVIYPELHYGRDALVGAALLLSYLSKEEQSCSKIKEKMPCYCIVKNKILLDKSIKIDKIFAKIEKKYNNHYIDKRDGVKIIFKNNKSWLHLRKSNTEPIIRVYCEASDKKEALNIFKDLKKFVLDN